MRKFAIAAVIVALVASSGCASILGRTGREARQHVLVPTLIQAWPGVYTDVLHGINDAQGKGDILATTASQLVIRTGDWDRTLSEDEVDVARVLALRARDWDEFQFYALRGIASRETVGTIGPTVAGELRERITAFDDALVALSGEPTNPE